MEPITVVALVVGIVALVTSIVTLVVVLRGRRG